MSELYVCIQTRDWRYTRMCVMYFGVHALVRTCVHAGWFPSWMFTLCCAIALAVSLLIGSTPLPLLPALDLFSLNRQRYPEDQRDCVTLTKLYRREGRKRRNWNKTANTIKKRRRRRRWAASGGVGGMKKNKISFLPTLIANSSLLLSAEWRNSM
jgi:hypothetical protein